MGCDIHLYGEKRIRPSWWQFWKRSKWVTIDKWSIEDDFGDLFDNPRQLSIKRSDRIYTDGRNYNLFCALAGVRSYCFEGDPPIISKPKGLPKDCCIEIKSESKSWGSDGHSHSWNTLSELIAFDWSEYGETCNVFINEVIPKLKAYNTSPEDIRIVYFFDN